jgi:prolyl oligopeptidase
MSLSQSEAPSTGRAEQDSYLWLEDVGGERAITWVRAHNAASERELEGTAGFESLRRRLLAIYESNERIANVTKHGAYLYNFWRDERQVRGVWRRTTLEEYRKAEPAWEIVLDLDRLAASEKENWVWKGADILPPSHDRALLFLSRGGADAAVMREFDLVKKDFVVDGFTLPEAKSRVAWRNRDALYIGSDFGPGSLTSSGYPRVVKQWQRGTPLGAAKTVFEGKVDDVSVTASVVHDHGRIYELISRGLTFFTNELWFRRGDDWVRIDKPADARVETFTDQILLRLRSDWSVGGKTYRAGSLLAAEFEAYLRGDREFAILFEPSERKALASTSQTKNYLILNELDNVRSKVYALKRTDGQWQRQQLATPAFGSVRVRGVDAHADDDASDDYFMSVTDFLTPSSLVLGRVGAPTENKLKSLPAFFSAVGLAISQHQAVSKDGTEIPYFQVSRKDSVTNGRRPTLLYGYGGFNVSQLPFYSGTLGAAWLERVGRRGRHPYVHTHAVPGKVRQDAVVVAQKVRGSRHAHRLSRRARQFQHGSVDGHRLQLAPIGVH